MAHTPGPFEIEEKLTPFYINAEGDTRGGEATGFYKVYAKVKCEDENGKYDFKTFILVPMATRDDAQLIAAAPDLLAVCKRVADAPKEIQRIMRVSGLKVDNLADPMQKLVFSIYTTLCELDYHARAAIAKAEEAQQA